MDTELEPVSTKALSKPGFHNQSAMKARGRTQILEALTAFKGESLGKKGLLFKVLADLDRDMDSTIPEVRVSARDSVIKIALAITKDDKASDLSDMLKGGSNIQINFNSYFQERDRLKD